MLPFLSSTDDVFHSLGKEDHRQLPPASPRNGSAGLTSLPPLSGPSLPPAPTAHLPTMGLQPFPKMAAPDFVEPGQDLCHPPTEAAAPSVDGSVSAAPSICRYQADPGCQYVPEKSFSLGVCFYLVCESEAKR